MLRRLLLCSVLLMSAVAFAEDWTKTYKVGASPTLTVNVSDAGIEVRAGGDGTIDARLEVRGYSLTGSNPDIRITETQSGDTVNITAKERSGTHWCIACVRSAHMTITAPAGTRLKLRTSDGSVKIFNTKAPADLSTSDGSIEVNGFDGVLHARTSDGSIHAVGRFDDLDLSTSDGSITCTADRGSKVATDWRIHTSDGSVRINLPEDVAADVHLSTGDGTIHSELPIDGVHDPGSKHNVSGKYNGGGRLLDVRTSDGSIHIARN